LVPMSRRIDMIGRRVGRLVVICEGTPTDARRRTKWKCRCDCGAETEVDGGVLRRGDCRSCGCYQKECAAAQFRKHGHRTQLSHGHSIHTNRSRTYNIWCSAKQRCFYPKHKGFKYWGGRGITMCDRWKNSFETFLQDMGECPLGLTLDRFPNKDGNYEPGNCRWATYLEQGRNRRVPRGEQAHNAKLTADKVLDVHRRLAAGESARAIGRLYGVGRSAINSIRDGHSWRHVKKEAVA